MAQKLSVFILYNPNSTGTAKQEADDYKQAIHEVDQAISCEVIATQHEGHAVELAESLAGPGVMIISSSGDGGFHEVVNGVLKSNHAGSTIVGLLPGGNANDHYHARHVGDIAKRIKTRDSLPMDVLAVDWGNKTIFAHSYAGIGITADIGHELTKTDLNPLKEALIVLRGLFQRHPVVIRLDGRIKRYDSFICNLIGQMSKYLTTGEKDRPQDGTFDIMTKRHTSLFSLLRHLFYHAAHATIDDATAKTKLEFTMMRPAKIQLDGEVYYLKAGDNVTIRCLPEALRSII